VTERLVCAEPDGTSWIALVIKRTYSIRSDGRCVLSDEQVPIDDGSTDYEDVEAPRVSAPRWDSDLLAFKEATDVVIQGQAYCYGQRVSTVAEVHSKKISRIVRVFGERQFEWTNGNARITPPRSFESMPLRYKLAYGGCDTAALKAHGDPALKMFGDLAPEWKLGEQTRFHYPRNLAGCGYLTSLTKESVEAAVVPNLEFADDPLTPERMAVAVPEDWLEAPIPAGFDWFDPRWFPRVGYLGLTPEHNVPRKPIAEVALGWAPPDLLELPSLFELEMHPKFLQAASPGLAVSDLSSGEIFQFRNVFPRSPEFNVELPRYPQDVSLHLSHAHVLSIRPFLTAVVFQPDADRVICIWSARARSERVFAECELQNMSWSIIES
jgi:hypothetical protein